MLAARIRGTWSLMRAITINVSKEFIITNFQPQFFLTFSEISL